MRPFHIDKIKTVGKEFGKKKNGLMRSTINCKFILIRCKLIKVEVNKKENPKNILSKMYFKIL